MKALWFIVFAWLFFGGTTVPAKRANREVKSLPTEHLDCLDELFHKVQGSGTESWEVMEPPRNAHASRFALHCLSRFMCLDPLTRLPTEVLCPRCVVGGTLRTFGQPPRLRRIFNLPSPFWMRQAMYRCAKCNGTPRASRCLLKGIAREHFRVYLTRETRLMERRLLHCLGVIDLC